MANNRMWLIYKPTGHAVCLGKRMASGWYLTSPPAHVHAALAAMFDLTESIWIDGKGGLDDFALGFEDPGKNPHSFNDWRYGAASDSGVRQLQLFDHSPFDPPNGETEKE